MQRNRSIRGSLVIGILCAVLLAPAHTFSRNRLGTAYLSLSDTVILTAALTANLVLKHSDTIASLWNHPKLYSDSMELLKGSVQTGDIQLADSDVEQWIVTQMQEWKVTQAGSWKKPTAVEIYVLVSSTHAEPHASVQKIGSIQPEVSGHQTDVVVLRINPSIHDIIKHEAQASYEDIEMTKALLQHMFAHVVHDHLDLLTDVKLIDLVAQTSAIAVIASRQATGLSSLMAYFIAGLGLPVLQSFISRRLTEHADDCIETQVGGQKLFNLCQKEIDEYYANLPWPLRCILPKELYSHLINPHHPTPKARLERLNARFLQDKSIGQLGNLH